MEPQQQLVLPAVKAKISLLWVIGTVLEAAHLLLIIDTEGLWLKRHGNLLVHATFFFLLPLLLATLTVLLSDKWSRKVNLILCLFPMLPFYIINFLECGLGVLMYTGPVVGPEQALMLGMRVVLTVIILWLVKTWPGLTNATPLREHEQK